VVEHQRIGQGIVSPTKCPVCQNIHSDAAKIISQSGRIRVDCLVCGRYILSEEVWDDQLNPQSAAGHKLSDLTRARLSHRLITGRTLDNSTDWILLSKEFLDHFIEDGGKGPTPSEQAINITKYVGDAVSRSGSRLRDLPTGFYAKVGAPNPDFTAELALELARRGILSGIDTSSASGSGIIDIGLTLDGWDRYEAERRGEISGNFGFIAMKFDDSVLDPFVENVVKPTVKDGTGYELVDMRSVARAGIIDNIMRAQIRDSAFVIVDLTHDNSGAYWEAGYAEGLGKPVIYICEKEKFDDAKTHFDTNHCTTVLWSAKENSKFRLELIATLRRSLNLFETS
jgi:hypothetical protein